MKGVSVCYWPVLGPWGNSIPELLKSLSAHRSTHTRTHKSINGRLVLADLIFGVNWAMRHGSVSEATITNNCSFYVKLAEQTANLEYWHWQILLLSKIITIKWQWEKFSEWDYSLLWQRGYGVITVLWASVITLAPQPNGPRPLVMAFIATVLLQEIHAMVRMTSKLRAHGTR